LRLSPVRTRSLRCVDLSTALHRCHRILNLCVQLIPVPLPSKCRCRLGVLSRETPWGESASVSWWKTSEPETNLYGALSSRFTHQATYELGFQQEITSLHQCNWDNRGKQRAPRTVMFGPLTMQILWRFYDVPKERGSGGGWGRCYVFRGVCLALCEICSALLMACRPEHRGKAEKSIFTHWHC